MSNIYIMTRQQETYLALLRAALWSNLGEAVNGLMDERINELTRERVNEIIHLASFQGTGPLVYDQLLKLKDLDIPADLRMQMKQQCAQSMMLQQSMLCTLTQAWNALVKVDVHPVLLKGFALAQYYPQPHLRQWGDIDLYVGQKQYHAACKALKAIFPNADYPPEEDEERKHFNFILPNTVLELHRISMAFAHPRDRRYYELLEEQYLTKNGPSFKIEGVAITMPEETFNIFFVFLHAWHHFATTGMSMKQLCDVAILLHAHKDIIDRVHLKEMLNTLCLMEVWQLIMYIMVHQLGVLQEECPFYTEKSKERAELLFERVLVEGSARKAENGIKIEDGKLKNANYLKRKWTTLQWRLIRSKLVRFYAPVYARHMVISDILHGLERTFNGK